MKYILILFLSFCASASEIVFLPPEGLDPLIKKLGDEDFDVREKATAAILDRLCWVSADYIAHWSKDWEKEDPEIADRLKQIVGALFERDVLIKDDHWQRLHGRLEFEHDSCYNTPWVVTSSWGGCDQSIHRWDIVTAIDDKEPPRENWGQVDLTTDEGWGLFKAGQEYDLKILRPSNIEQIRSRGYISGNDSFDEIHVKAKAVYNEEPSQYLVDLARDQAWDKFVSGMKIEKDFTYRPFLFPSK